jgi:nitrate/nitrite-specific signal transduction histidine kinase
MRWWQQRGLRFKLAFGIVLTMVIILGIATFVALEYIQAQLWQRETQAAEHLNAMAETLLVDAMMAGRKDTIQAALTKLGQSIGGQIDSIAVYDDQALLTAFATGFAGGRVIPVDSLAVALTDPTCWVCHQLPAKERPTLTTVTVQGQEVLRNVVPLYNEPRCQTCHGSGQTVLGASIVDLRLEPYRRTAITIQISLGLGIALAVALVGMVLYRLLDRVILSPLEEISAATQSVVAGDMSRELAIRSQDEMGRLGTAFNTMTRQLRTAFASLEQRVAERTRDLDRRSAYLEASTEIGRTAASELDPEKLLNGVVNRIRERFDLYYVGLFLVDDRNQQAILRAGTGQAGQAMLARKHSLKLGEGMIGWCINHAEARIALDVGKDAVHFDNPDLPETRSEAALPLRSRGRVLGALTVQSQEANAFDQDSINVLQIMADQVALALDNAELFSQSEAALAAERRAYQDLSRAAWSELLQTREITHYLCDTRGVVHPVAEPQSPDLTEPRQGQVPQAVGDTVILPIKLRDQTLGGLRLKKPENSRWSGEEIELVQTLANQLSIALESARLYSDTQKQAQRERLTANLTDKIHRSLDMDSLMKTLLAEISAALGATAAFVQLGTPEGLPDETGSGNGQSTARHPATQEKPA